MSSWTNIWPRQMRNNQKNGQGERIKINLRYMQKNQKTITLDKRTAKTKLMKNNVTKKHNYRYCSSQLLTVDESYSLTTDRMTELTRATPSHFRRLLRRCIVTRNRIRDAGAITRLKMKINQKTRGRLINKIDSYKSATETPIKTQPELWSRHKLTECVGDRTQENRKGKGKPTGKGPRPRC